MEEENEEPLPRWWGAPHEHAWRYFVCACGKDEKRKYMMVKSEETANDHRQYCAACRKIMPHTEIAPH